jgi:cysteine sulfinate desulfinase/cysteine desulfurase-like protein
MTTIATKPVYLDYNATTPVDPDVLKAMLPYLNDEFGNPSSAHALGRRARDAVEAARTEVAGLIGAMPDEILFASGGTEANNIAIRGTASANRARSAIVTTAIEHPATEACCAFLESQGKKVTRIKPNADATVDAEKFIAAIDYDTALATIIHAQNETGTLQPVSEISVAARRRGTTIHADAAQSVGKIAVDVNELGADLLSIAGHKLYAPKGMARCTSGVVSICLRCCSARARNTAAAPAPKTSPLSSGSAKPAGSPKGIYKQDCTNSRASPMNSTAGSSARYSASGLWVARRNACPTR